MITPPTDWHVDRTASGLLLFGRGGSCLVYVERRRPLAPPSVLVRRASRPASFVEQTPPRVRRFATYEGEHAALVTHDGAIGSDRYVLVYGYVLLDDYFASLEGMVAPEQVELVEQMLLEDVHLLGRDRRRRFLYTPPSGWDVDGDSFDVRYEAPDRHARIFVNAALPAIPGLVPAIVSRLADQADAIASPVAVVNRYGLGGEHHALRVRGDDIHVFVLTDDRYVYAVRGDHDYSATFALVASIEPVPRRAAAPTDAMEFWAQ